VNVGLFLTFAEELDLRVGDNADNGAVFLHLGKVLFDLLFSVFRRPFLGILGECLLFRLVPVLIESSSDFFGEMFGPNGLEGPHAVRRIDVTDDADDHDGRSLDDGDGFDDFLLVHFGPGTIHDAANVSHTSLVTGEGGEMDRLLGVILGERLDSAFVILASLFGEKSQVAVTRRREFPVRHRNERLKDPYLILKF